MGGNEALNGTITRLQALMFGKSDKTASELGLSITD